MIHDRPAAPTAIPADDPDSRAQERSWAACRPPPQQLLYTDEDAVHRRDARADSNRAQEHQKELLKPFPEWPPRTRFTPTRRLVYSIHGSMRSRLSV